jgi:hypothetical protein
MAKRYHNSMGAEHYAGSDSRRHQEMQDSGMIHEDHSKIANLPQEVMIKSYSYAGAEMPDGLDDTIRGIDMQMSYDNSKRKEHFKPKKV